mgnify:CR=1 FL=1
MKGKKTLIKESFPSCTQNMYVHIPMLKWCPCSSHWEEVANYEHGGQEQGAFYYNVGRKFEFTRELRRYMYKSTL